jgi:tRNA(Ile)-lysidine synthase
MLDELLARCTFPPPATNVTCAFSGGPDSTALVALARHAGLSVEALHVDHGLRPTSGTEAERAVAIAAELGVTARVATVRVEPGANLQARARHARHGVLPPGALTGHTADDRAETMLINLLRGAGLDGLSALGPAPTRPLLALRRTETRALCDHLGLRPMDDPTNHDRRFVRNRVREELIPLLDDIAGRDTVALLTRTADMIAGDLGVIDELSSTLDATDARALAAAPPARARRAVRRWLAGDGYPPDAATVARVLAVAGGRNRACELPGGRRVERSRQRLRIVDGTASEPASERSERGRSPRNER